MRLIVINRLDSTNIYNYIYIKQKYNDFYSHFCLFNGLLIYYGSVMSFNYIVFGGFCSANIIKLFFINVINYSAYIEFNWQPYFLY